ncbi:3-hydroxy-3-isohexenylglutaryl-CoA/hydroxy-methylglutaryl-CoA lyase [Azospirillaceae bacterium]
MLPQRVMVVEVGPRDGLQNEALPLPAAVKVELIERLADAGLPMIEAGAFVSARWVPQMADSAAVLAAVRRRPDCRYPVLVPNLQGYESARAAGADEVAIFTAASEGFSRRNINCSVDGSFERFAPLCAAATAQGVRVRGYVSCVLGCPYDGAVEPAEVARVAERLLGLGCDQISLGDTIGIGTAGAARAMVEAVAARVPRERLALHFHDTWGQALANILACLEAGIAIVDSSVAGLGGCPYARGASGNVATEDVLYMLNGLGVATGVDLPRVAATGAWISGRIGRQSGSRAGRAQLARG